MNGQIFAPRCRDAAYNLLQIRSQICSRCLTCRNVQYRSIQVRPRSPNPITPIYVQYDAAPDT